MLLLAVILSRWLAAWQRRHIPLLVAKMHASLSGAGSGGGGGGSGPLEKIKHRAISSLSFRQIVLPRAPTTSQTLLLYEPCMESHSSGDQLNGNDIGVIHPENAMRIKYPFHKITQNRQLLRHVRIDFGRDASDEELLLHHTRAYIDLIRSTQTLSGEALERLAKQYDSVYLSNGTWPAACRAAGCALHLIDQLCTKQAQNGFALIRPPGHHARTDSCMGYSVFNNATIAAKHARALYKMERILILDWDVHHGNGTQEAFYNDPHVLYISLHRYQDRRYWPHLMESNFNHIGDGAGRGFNINIPLNEIGCSFADYFFVFHHFILPIVLEYAPEIVIVSCGFDAARGDPKGQMLLEPEVFAHFVHWLKMFANGRLALLLEGGYNLSVVSDCVIQCLHALSGETQPIPRVGFFKSDQISGDSQLPAWQGPRQSVRDSVDALMAVLRPYWTCLQPKQLLPSHLRHAGAVQSAAGGVDTNTNVAVASRKTSQNCDTNSSFTTKNVGYGVNTTDSGDLASAAHPLSSFASNHRSHQPPLVDNSLSNFTAPWRDAAAGSSSSSSVINQNLDQLDKLDGRWSHADIQAVCDAVDEMNVEAARMQFADIHLIDGVSSPPAASEAGKASTPSVHSTPEHLHSNNNDDFDNSPEVHNNDGSPHTMEENHSVLSPSMDTVIAYDDRMLLHENSYQSSKPHVECKQRLMYIYMALERYELLKRCRVLPQPLQIVSDESILSWHTLKLLKEVDRFNELSDAVLEAYNDRSAGASIFANPNTSLAARVAAGGVIQCVDEVMSGRARNGFAIVRPPGHHAEADWCYGFCFFNNVVLATHHAQRQWNARRVLIVDWDVHHGNGVQNAFYDDPSVLYISLHQLDIFPGNGHEPELVGEDEGVGFNVNIGWNPSPSRSSNRRGGGGGSECDLSMKRGDAAYMNAFLRCVMPMAYEFDPDLVLVSAGFDSAKDDLLGNCSVTPTGFGLMTHMLMGVAGGRVILALEGGYNLRVMGECGAACTAALLGDQVASVDISQRRVADPQASDDLWHALACICSSGRWKMLLPPRDGDVGGASKTGASRKGRKR